MHMHNTLIIGATSAIAIATARRFAQKGHTLYLAARNDERLQSLSKDLKIRGAAEVFTVELDVNDFDRQQTVIESAFATLKSVDTVLLAHGTLPDQSACEQDVSKTLAEINTNALSTLSLLTLLKTRMQAQGNGTIAVITSVAGDRGRQSNYVYGSSKAMVSTFLQGLRNRLFEHGVNVVDIKPGFVDTPMTAHIQKKGALWAKPEKIAEGIETAIEKGRSTVYLPGFWRFIMLTIQHIPEVLFKRLKL